VNLELTDEQILLREAAAGVLGRLPTVAAARDATAVPGTMHAPSGLRPDSAHARSQAPFEAQAGQAPFGAQAGFWQVACDAGWPGLLVGEERGGAGLGAFDAMLVFEELGKRLSGAGLLGHLPATLVLDRAAAAGNERAAAELPALCSGERRAAILFAAEHQPDAAGADVLVVAAPGGPRLATDGELAVEPVAAYDASRPLGRADLSGLDRLEPLGAGEDVTEEAWHLAQMLLAADALGVSAAALDLGVAYAKDRHAFGRPIGSFQAIKQQLVESLRHTETARNLCFYAGLSAEQDPAELPLAAAAARFAGEQAADYATRTCIAVHGGIGATWEHDAPYYWRRAQLSRLLHGGIAGAGDRVAEEIIARARKASETTQQGVS
jgi:alkylation response protein AidB-like acyl-CoA dehydrogenase